MITLTAGIIAWTVAASTPNVAQLESKTLKPEKKIEVVDRCSETIKKKVIFKNSATEINEDPGIPEQDFTTFIQKPASSPSSCNHKGFLYKKIAFKDNTGSYTLNNEDSKWEMLELDNVPNWIRPKLMLTVSKLSEEIWVNLHKELKSISDKEENLKYLDELFFVIAYSSPVEVEKPEFSPEMILQSIKTIYASSTELNYAELIEKGSEETGELTTVSLKIKDSETIKEIELDPWLYYAFIVHPRLDGEVLGAFSPSDNTFMDIGAGGTDFRSNFFYGEPVSQSYSGHYIFRNDWNVDLEKLQMPDGGHSCPIIFSVSEFDKLDLISSSAGSCFTETFIGNGNIVSIGLDMENIDNRLTLSNLMGYGNGYCSLKGKLILVLEDEEDAKFLRDSIEFYLSDYEYVLLENLTEEILFSKTEDNAYTLNAGKIVIPPSMSDNFYKKISEMKDSFDTFASQGGSVMMFLYSKDSSPCSFELPGGVKCSKNSEKAENFKLSGHPILKDHLENTGFYYETGLEPYYLEGEVPLNKEASAIEKTGDWIGLNMQRNIAEMNKTSEKVERAIQAVRVAYNHYGNCGENQDMSGAAMKTAFIPVINVNNSAEDHVWNEIWTPEGWMPMQSAWSNYSQDYGTVGKICMEKKFDGGKDISYVYAWRGDHIFFNRTATYTDTVTTNLKVIDSEGNGVPDAAVMIATESYYDKTQLTIAGSTGTNELGEATLITGDNRNIYIQIISDSLGVFPGIQKVEKIINAEDASSGSQFEYTAKLSMKLPAVIKTTVTEGEFIEGNKEITVDLAASQFISHVNPFNDGTVFKSLENVSGKVHIFDESQFESFKSSGTASSIATFEIKDLPATVSVLEDSIYYAVFVSDRLGTTVGEIFIESDAEENDSNEESADDSDSSKSDGCSLTVILEVSEYKCNFLLWQYPLPFCRLFFLFPF